MCNDESQSAFRSLVFNVKLFDELEGTTILSKAFVNCYYDVSFNISVQYLQSFVQRQGPRYMLEFYTFKLSIENGISSQNLLPGLAGLGMLMEVTNNTS